MWSNVAASLGSKEAREIREKISQSMTLEDISKAQELGYTEPNPKDDLNGMDVARKMLIISRLIGIQMEMEDIKNIKI